MASFRQRLKACVDKGQMQVSDLHHWFERPRATVRYWLLHKDAATYEPRDDPKGREAWHRLRLLEWGIAKNTFFPVPLELSAHARPEHIRYARRVLDKQIPGSGLTEKRAQRLLRYQKGERPK